MRTPPGTLSTYWRQPDHRFDPLDFGAYVLAGENYTKLTNLWVGGGFVMPEKRPVPQGDGPNPIHWASPGPERANKRSLTPRGFAQAVFEANSHRVAIVTPPEAENIGGIAIINGPPKRAEV